MIPQPLRQNARGWPWLDGGASAETTPRISIITPSYNQADFIEETIRSILLQNYPNIEHIIMDGGSTDGTVEILRHYDAHITWVSEPDGGQADAINKGLKRATGDILAYLNSDDVYLPTALQTVAAYFQANPQVGLLYGDTEAIWADGRPKGMIHGRPFDLHKIIHRGHFLPQQSTFWTRAAMQKAGWFDASQYFAMDYEYFIRLGQVTQAAYLPLSLSQFRFHESSKSVTGEERHWRDILTVSEAYGMKPWTIWWWIRRIRHRALRGLPPSLEMRVRRLLNRGQDPVLTSDR